MFVAQSVLPKISHLLLHIFSLVLKDRVKCTRIQIVKLSQQIGHEVHPILPEVDPLKVLVQLVNMLFCQILFPQTIGLQCKQRLLNL
jgi:hypothetical protein